MTTNNNKKLSNTDYLHMTNAEVAYYDRISSLMTKAEKMRRGTWKDFFKNFYSED